MKNRGAETIFGVNTVIQAIFSLLTPPAVGALISWLLCAKFSVGAWIYALLISVGVIIGLISMIKFILAAADTQKALREAQREAEARREDQQDGDNG